MRIVIAMTADVSQSAGGGFDHYSTDPDREGRHMTDYSLHDYGVKVIHHDGEFRVYPWSTIKFLDVFNTS